MLNSARMNMFLLTRDRTLTPFTLHDAKGVGHHDKPSSYHPLYSSSHFAHFYILASLNLFWFSGPKSLRFLSYPIILPLITHIIVCTQLLNE